MTDASRTRPEDPFAGVMGAERGIAHGAADADSAVRRTDTDLTLAGFLVGRDLAGQTSAFDVRFATVAPLVGAGTGHEFSFLLDHAGRPLAWRVSRRDHAHVTVRHAAGDELIGALRATCPSDADLVVRRLTVKATLSELAQGRASRAAMLAAGLAEADAAAGMIKLTDRQRIYLQAIAEHPTEDVYAVGRRIDGHRSDKTDAACNGLLERGLLDVVSYANYVPSDDGRRLLEFTG